MGSARDAGGGTNGRSGGGGGPRVTSTPVVNASIARLDATDWGLLDCAYPDSLPPSMPSMPTASVETASNARGTIFMAITL
jgi:hypothetical protein